jgi:hypothetical protein
MRIYQGVRVSASSLYVIKHHMAQPIRHLSSSPHTLKDQHLLYGFPDLLAQKPQAVADRIHQLFPFKILSKEEMQFRLRFLKEEKWRECIDGVHASYGKYVYNQGLHKKGVIDAEPLYIESMMNAVDLIAENADLKLNACFYLKVHSLACAHFSHPRAENFTICQPDEIGKFRKIRVFMLISPKRALKPKVLEELDDLNKKVHAAYFETKEDKQCGLIYEPCESDEEMLGRFTFVLNEYHQQIKDCHNPDDKLHAIAKFYQQCQWLHTTTDGCGRLDIAILNMLLTQNGFHPVILDYPYVSSTHPLSEWKKALKQGLNQWLDVGIKIDTQL